MIKNIINKIKTSRKIQLLLIIYLVLYIGIVAICAVPLNKVVITPGVLTNPNEFITVDTNYSQGQITTIGVYVKYKPTIFEYLISNGNKKMDVSDYDSSSDLSPRDNILRSTYLKDLSVDYALINAYKEANKVDSTISIDYSFVGLQVTANLPNSYSKELVIGDIIEGVYVNDEYYSLSLRNYPNYDTYLSENNIADSAINYFKYVTSDSQIKHGSFKLKVEDKKIEFKYMDNKYLYLELADKYNITSATPKYTIDPQKVHNTIGSSGGMMLALAIYNSLIKEDQTKGLRICGTGTINLNGNIGEIGGITQKIHTTQLYKADVFFCPYYEGDENNSSSNYSEAKKAYDSIKNPCFNFVKVSSLSDILDYLNSYSKN